MYEHENHLTEEEVIDGLQALLCGEDIEDTLLGDCWTRTFAEGGYLTYDNGFTIHTADGSVFQITVKQER